MPCNNPHGAPVRCPGAARAGPFWCPSREGADTGSHTRPGTDSGQHHTL